MVHAVCPVPCPVSCFPQRSPSAVQRFGRASLAQLRAFPTSRKLFLDPAGNPLPDGYVLRNPYPRTYRTLAAQGPSALYTGAIGRAISASVRRLVVAADAPFTVLPGDDLGRPQLARSTFRYLQASRLAFADLTA